MYAFNISLQYREAYGIHITNGILFNHESPRRSRTFVTRKITTAVAEIVHGKRFSLELGNLNAKRDWGYAPEYVEAMWKMLQLDDPVDLVIATGQQHSVKQFCEFAFSHVGLDFEKYVTVSKQFYRPLEVESLQGDYSQAKKLINWEPKILATELARIMVDSDLKLSEFRF